MTRWRQTTPAQPWRRCCWRPRPARLPARRWRLTRRSHRPRPPQLLCWRRELQQVPFLLLQLRLQLCRLRLRHHRQGLQQPRNKLQHFQPWRRHWRRHQHQLQLPVLRQLHHRRCWCCPLPCRLRRRRRTRQLVSTRNARERQRPAHHVTALSSSLLAPMLSTKNQSSAVSRFRTHPSCCRAVVVGVCGGGAVVVVVVVVVVHDVLHVLHVLDILLLDVLGVLQHSTLKPSLVPDEESPSRSSSSLQPMSLRSPHSQGLAGPPHKAAPPPP